MRKARTLTTGDRAWRWVGLSMAGGALYDATFGLAILFLAGPAASLMGLQVPADPVYFRLNGIFLLLLAGLYWLPSRDPVRYRGVVAVAALGRLAGFGYFAAVWVGGAPHAFLALAYGDLAFAGLHLLLLHAADASATRSA